jgi:hypothetical protein
MLGPIFAGRGLLCFVGVSSLTTRISSSLSSRSLSGFNLSHMDNPLRHLPIPRVVLFLPTRECVSFDYKYA